MAWDRYGAWHGGWNGWTSPTGYQHSPAEQFAYNHDAFGTWQPWSNSMYAGAAGESMPAPSNGCGATLRPSANGSLDPTSVKPLPFDALRKLMGDDGSDDSDAEPGVGDRHPSDQESTSASGRSATARCSSADEAEARCVGKDASTRGAKATQEERDEAERVLKNAFYDAKERDRLRSQVSKASPSDLQAMLNARLDKPPHNRC
jgi:hypothetical protein